MIKWNPRGVSWSKLRLALTCQKSLGFEVTRTPRNFETPSFHREHGILVQHIFELYFNQGINLRDSSLQTLRKCAQRVLDAKLPSLEVTYPDGKNFSDFLSTVWANVEGGYEAFERTGLLKRKLYSEVELKAQYRGMNLFGHADFVHSGSKGVSVFDGKGFLKPKRGDSRQLLYYALALHAQGRKLHKGGFLYWHFGTFDPVDVSPAALRRFVDEILSVARPVIEQLKVGVEGLPANPSYRNCRYCPWKLSCKDAYKPSSPNPSGTQEVKFGEGR